MVSEITIRHKNRYLKFYIGHKNVKYCLIPKHLKFPNNVGILI